MARSPASHTVRIIGGDWRGRRLPVANVDGLRPSGDRVRETLFNWLAADLPGARVLDLFAGTGALGFEALSRGAAFATLIDCDPEALRLLRDNAGRLRANCEVVAGDARRLLAAPPPAAPYDLVFVDPPFADKAPMQLCTLLSAQGWLNAGARIYVEQARRDAGPVPAGFVATHEKNAGQVHFGLYRAAGTQGES